MLLHRTLVILCCVLGCSPLWAFVYSKEEPLISSRVDAWLETSIADESWFTAHVGTWFQNHGLPDMKGKLLLFGLLGEAERSTDKRERFGLSAICTFEERSYTGWRRGRPQREKDDRLGNEPWVNASFWFGIHQFDNGAGKVLSAPRLGGSCSIGVYQLPRMDFSYQVDFLHHPSHDAAVRLDFFNLSGWLGTSVGLRYLNIAEQGELGLLLGVYLAW